MLSQRFNLEATESHQDDGAMWSGVGAISQLSDACSSANVMELQGEEDGRQWEQYCGHVYLLVIGIPGNNTNILAAPVLLLPEMALQQVEAG